MQGKVVKILNNVIEIYFENTENTLNLAIDYIISLHNSKTLLIIEKVVSKNLVRALILFQNQPISINDDAWFENKKLQVPIGQKTKGHLFNIAGTSVLDPYETFETVDLNKKYQKSEYSIQNNTFLETGIKIIDFFIPIFKGDKLGIFGGAGVGKTVLMKELIFNLSRHSEDSFKTVSPVFIGTGERIREGQELYQELKDSGLLDKSIMFVAQMDETPGARQKIVSAGITSAEYLRDIEKEDVLLFIDNIYRFIQAGNELSASLAKKPSSAGYQPTLVSEVSSVQERLTTNENGGITSFQTVFLPMDDFEDPGSVAMLSHLDASLVLSRDVVAEGIFPAVDPLLCESNSIKEEKIGKRHFDAVIKTKEILQKFKDLKDMILILGIDQLDKENWTIVRKAMQITNFFSQHLFSASNFTKEKGAFVPLEKTISSIEQIINGDFISRDPFDFLYIESTENLETDQQIQEREQQR
ncbi:MSC_0618 family F1-like ATPase beta subunit [Mycoplasma procyoni]|uniref:MSC_0618 family F1-like ATPase beta subunit n=1 Tax=Mycoplasma procyoni TaxID=568784 RepID=UPI00197BF8A1|nr:F0F1 ATP synthase subunit beta [Mycoplasma procyoni]MBN3534772.1 F0F1 ATP synthase subunit beta [Mycoplasma procyoni]